MVILSINYLRLLPSFLESVFSYLISDNTAITVVGIYFILQFTKDYYSRLAIAVRGDNNNNMPVRDKTAI